ncbi:amidohydrolase family protein [Candidatus Aerophobetes bacterium]|nr:amidohydrolase family protein [Candidatus Aerophobetes bacterium]
MKETLFEQVREKVEEIPIVDIHEHFIPEKERLSTPLDIFYLFPHYASSDLVSSGMPHLLLDKVRSSNLSLEEKWEMFKPYWMRIKNTAYSKALLIIAKDIFGVEDINDETYRVLSQRIASIREKDWYRKVLREMANIECCIHCYLGPGRIYAPAPKIEESLEKIDRRLESMKFPPLDEDLLKPVGVFDGIVGVWNLRQIRMLEQEFDKNIYTLDDLLEILDLSFEKSIKRGIVAVKTLLAYNRVLYYEKVSKFEAEKVFNRIFDHMGEGLSWKEAKPLQDFLMHQVIQRAIEAKLPLQVHTGLQEGTGNIITNSHPSHLVNLFIQYPAAKFDILHASYPYTAELTAIAKNFPNVYVDLCWVYIISPYAARRILSEWIETLPSNKIFGFGGDYLMVEGAYAHAKIARDSVAKVLAEKIEEGYFSFPEAIEFARKIFKDNPVEFFNLTS